MAKQIRETPILRGCAAVRFDKIIKENENRKVSREEYDRAKRAYELIPLKNR